MFIINFKTIRYKLTASGNIIHSILNYKPMRPVSYLRLPSEQKQQIQKKLSEKSVEGIKKWSAMGFPSFINIISKNQQIWLNTSEAQNLRENTYYQRP